MSRLQLLVSDFWVSFIWVWSGSVLRYLVTVFLGPGMDPISLLIKGSLASVYLYSFTLVSDATNGGSFNPLMVFCHAIFKSFAEFLFAVFGRIPFQVFGSVIGVWVTNATFPMAAFGPRLSVDVHHGAMVEGSLTFLIMVISIGLKKAPLSSSTKAWISSVSKVVLHVLASDTTGGVMNPAAAFAWAYAQGQHLTREHLYVYWLAPVEAILLSVWTCTLFILPQKNMTALSRKYKIE